MRIIKISVLHRSCNACLLLLRCKPRNIVFWENRHVFGLYSPSSISILFKYFATYGVLLLLLFSSLCLQREDLSFILAKLFGLLIKFIVIVISTIHIENIACKSNFSLWKRLFVSFLYAHLEECVIGFDIL